MTTLKQRLAEVNQRLAAAEQAAGRPPGSVRLLAASKTRTAEDVRQAVALGQRLFGENRAQELRDKGDALADEDLEWHFIGSLQKNKVKYCVGRATLIHSVDSLSLAEAIDKRSAKHMADAGGAPIGVLVQVDIGEEDAKGGVPIADTLAICRQVDAMAHVSLRGLMAVPPFTEDPQGAAPYFARLASLAAAGREAGLPLGELSMGMSHDLEVAVAYGATIVRVGSAIFGPRQY
ncbi:MAG: YggS family pyridoxal phosphate-dependent enzyme [Myxococcota bacterium]